MFFDVFILTLYMFGLKLVAKILIKFVILYETMKKNALPYITFMRICMILLLHVLIINKAASQITEDFESTRDRFFFGGNVGLMFGTVTDIEVAPQIGYYITKRWASGVGITYKYYKDDRFDINTHIYGGSIFTRYFLFPDLSTYFPVNEGISLFAQGEYIALSLENKYFSNDFSLNDSGRFISDNYLLGGGIMQRFSKRGGFYFMVLVLLNESDHSAIQNPVLRIGFIF